MCTCVYVYVLNKCIIYGSTVTISMYIVDLLNVVHDIAQGLRHT